MERRIRNLLQRRKAFYLETLSIDDNKTLELWYIDGGGWVSKQGELQDVQYKHIGHIKNLLEFLEQPVKNLTIYISIMWVQCLWPIIMKIKDYILGDLISLHQRICN